MQYLTFDIPYQEAYSTMIEFKTEINEKMQGDEQRYPVWTYPKRTFCLKFDKNFSQRQKLEKFFIDVKGRAGKFYFTWDSAKGGNGQTYLCSFNSDSFKQAIQDFGYTNCELEFECIDKSYFKTVENLDFYHKVESDFVMEFYTIVDKILTAQDNRNSYMELPKRSWTLVFEKNAINRKKLEDFFIAKRGRFHSFKWVWRKEFGGDGKTYNVRFDEDVLCSEIDAMGYGEIKVKLKEVFPKLNPLYEEEKDEIIPRRLLKIDLEQGPIYILDNETLEYLSYGGQDYIGAPLQFDEISKNDNTSVSKLGIELSNVGLTISGLIGQRGDVLTNAPAVLTLVFLDLLTNTIIYGKEQVLFAGKCNNLKLDYETAKLDIETSLGGYEIQAPAMKYRTTCQVRRFKDCRCGYNGNELSCDRTFARCNELGNQANFRGFPQMYNELVIKV